jgi:transposase-like protein
VDTERWGTFRTRQGRRQRYRCRTGCRRTFSDLTATPLAYSKRPEAWRAYHASMTGGRTLRRTAQDVGIHLSTSFRWRHRILAWHRGLDQDRLSGSIAIRLERFAESFKGQTRLPRAARPRAPKPWDLYGNRRVTVLFARDGAGRVVSSPLPPGIAEEPLPPQGRPDWPAPAQLKAALDHRLHDRQTCRFTAVYGPYGPSPRLVRLLPDGYTVKLPPPPQQHEEARPLIQYVIRYRRWMTRFRGVATRYLPHYLLWHRKSESPSSALRARPPTHSSREQNLSRRLPCPPSKPLNPPNPPPAHDRMADPPAGGPPG